MSGLNFRNIEKLTKPGPKIGKAREIKEHERLGKALSDFNIYRAFKGGSGLVCFAQYDCADSQGCLGYIFDGPYTLVCKHCLIEIIKEMDGEC